jgi:hypothetical protein
MLYWRTKEGSKGPLPNIRIADNNCNNHTDTVSKKYNADIDADI